MLINHFSNTKSGDIMGVGRSIATYTLGFICGLYVGVGGCSDNSKQVTQITPEIQTETETLREEVEDITDIIREDPAVQRMERRLGELRDYIREKL